jgi:hypothetical protein
VYGRYVACFCLAFPNCVGLVRGMEWNGMGAHSIDQPGWAL